MANNYTILITEDDEGHAALIEKNLRRSGIMNDIIHFRDGEQVLAFMRRTKPELRREIGMPYLLLLDIRMPKVDGVQVLKQLKEDPELRKMPVIMLTTTDDPKEIDMCHRHGCNSYVTKPVEYEKFIEAIRSLGSFLKIVQVPEINGKFIYRDNRLSS